MAITPNLEEAYSAGLRMFTSSTEPSSPLVLLPACVFFARNGYFARREDVTSLIHPPRFDELNDLELAAVQGVYEAIAQHDRQKGKSEVPSPSIYAFLFQLSSELGERAGKISSEIYEQWLVASVEAASATIGKIGDDDLLPHYGDDALVKPGVLIYRKPRKGSKDWTQARSWFGGRPRLGEQQWPRDSTGKPIHFAAQLDLAEIAEVWRLVDLPKSGSLAFFVGATGAVVYVPASQDTVFTEPPADLPPFVDAGFEVPGLSAALPFWPVGFMAMPLETKDEEAQYEEQQEFISSRFARREYYLSVEEVLGLRPRPQWWHSALLLFSDLHTAKSAGGYQKVAPLFDTLYADVEAWVSARSPWVQMDLANAQKLSDVLNHIRDQRMYCESQLSRRKNRVKSKNPYSLLLGRNYEAITLRLLAASSDETYLMLPKK